MMHHLFGNCEIHIPQYYELMSYIELVDTEETAEVEKPKWNPRLSGRKKNGTDFSSLFNVKILPRWNSPKWKFLLNGMLNSVPYRQNRGFSSSNKWDCE